MIYKSDDAERRATLAVADKLAAAARTAPKGCGVDEIEVIILDGKEKDALCDDMRKIAEETGADFFARDAGNLENSHCVVLVGVRDIQLGLDGCSLCGFENCSATKAAGANCAFKMVDLGIAIGSMVSIAADNRIDNRVMFSAGKAALRLNLFSDNVKVCFGIPLSAKGKSVFYDREAAPVVS